MGLCERAVVGCVWFCILVWLGFGFLGFWFLLGYGPCTALADARARAPSLSISRVPPLLTRGPVKHVAPAAAMLRTRATVLPYCRRDMGVNTKVHESTQNSRNDAKFSKCIKVLILRTFEQ